MLKLCYANIEQLYDENVFLTLFEKVNTQRREKILRCKNENDKYRSLLAGYLLRVALECEGMKYEDMCFSVKETGKPFIQNAPFIHYSLSHAGNYAVCLISDRSVGVDIETKTKKVFEHEEQLENIAKKILSEEEYEAFGHCINDKKAEMFLQFWTRKECYSKADGRGLGIGLNQVDTKNDRFFSKGLDTDVYLSIYVENGNFTDLQIEEVRV